MPVARPRLAQMPSSVRSWQWWILAIALAGLYSAGPTSVRQLNGRPQSFKHSQKLELVVVGRSGQVLTRPNHHALHWTLENA